MSDAPITRRTFIGVGAAAVVGVGVALGGWRWQSSGAGGGSSLSSTQGLVAFFSEPDAARNIGRAYLEGPAPGDSTDELAAQAFPSRPQPVRWLGRATRAEIADELGTQTAADFESGRVVRVAGWVLAESEAALCALYEVAVV